MTEFISINNFIKKSIDKSIEIRFVTFNGDGEKIYFSVGEKIVQLFYVEINGILQQRNVDYFFIDGTSRITFLTPPTPNSSITVVYYKGRTMNEQLIDVYGNLLVVKTEFQPSIEGVLTYFTEFNYTDIIFVTINGLIQEENVGYTISGVNEITFLSSLYVNSVVGISYIF